MGFNPPTFPPPPQSVSDAAQDFVDAVVQVVEDTTTQITQSAPSSTRVSEDVAQATANVISAAAAIGNIGTSYFQGLSKDLQSGAKRYVDEEASIIIPTAYCVLAVVTAVMTCFVAIGTASATSATIVVLIVNTVASLVKSIATPEITVARAVVNTTTAIAAANIASAKAVLAATQASAAAGFAATEAAANEVQLGLRGLEREINQFFQIIENERRRQQSQGGKALAQTNDTASAQASRQAVNSVMDAFRKLASIPRTHSQLSFDEQSRRATDSLQRLNSIVTRLTPVVQARLPVGALAMQTVFALRTMQANLQTNSVDIARAREVAQVAKLQRPTQPGPGYKLPNGNSFGPLKR